MQDKLQQCKFENIYVGRNMQSRPTCMLKYIGRFGEVVPPTCHTPNYPYCIYWLIVSMFDCNFQCFKSFQNAVMCLFLSLLPKQAKLIPKTYWFCFVFLSIASAHCECDKQTFSLEYIYIHFLYYPLTCSYLSKLAWFQLFAGQWSMLHVYRSWLSHIEINCIESI